MVHWSSGPPGGSQRWVCSSDGGVPAGTDGSVVSMAAVVANTWLPVAGALPNGDGLLGVSGDQTGVPSSWGPPALMRWVDGGGAAAMVRVAGLVVAAPW